MDVTSLAFSRVGRTLAAVSKGGNACLCPVS